MMEDPGIPRKHKVSHRFAATLGTNVLRMGVSFITGILLAHGLGPARYGDLNFLLATFVSLRAFMDLGSSSAFYTFISQSKKGLRFYLHYAAWLALQAAIVLFVVGLVLPHAWIVRLWVGQSRVWVLLAFGAIFLSTAVWKAAESLGEARRETIWIQRIRLAIAIIHLLLVGIGYLRHALNVPLIFWLMILEYAAATLWCIWKFDWDEALGPDEASLTVKAEIKLYEVYCRPLVLSSLVGFLWEYVGRWLLQFYGGAAQQGFFSIGQQFAAVSLLGATSLLNIFWKEIAAAHGEGNIDRLRHLFHKTTDMLFFSAAVISCCIIPFSRDILFCFLGQEYSGAGLSFSILILYPVYQTLGQLCGSYFLAAHETGKYFLISLVAMVLGTPSCYFLVASHGAVVPGLGLGAFGMAVNQLAVSYLLVNLQGWTISRSLGSRWPWGRQLCVMAALLVLAFACRGVSTLVIPLASSRGLLLSRMALAGLLYLPLAAGLAYCAPSLTGLDTAWVKAKLAV